jgi:hypothetical protein
VARLTRHGVTLLLTVVALLATAAGASAAAARPARPRPTPARAPPAPATTATATGTVNPGGVATTWYVEYGTSASYGSKTASASAGSGTANAPVSASLTGLTEGTTYHYRVVATSTAGTSHGSDGLFTTLAAPGVVTGSASAISVSSATLNGSVDPNARPTTWWFEYGTSTGYGSKTAVANAGSGTGPKNVAAKVTGLEKGRTYHYRLVATSDGGTTHGADASFLTSGAPSVATGGASSIAPTAARLNGVVTPNGLATTWRFDYGTTTSYGSRTSSHSAGSGTSPVNESIAISGLKVSTTYHFRIVASNSAGATFGSDRTFSTSLAPGVVTGAAQNVSATGATVGGTVDPRGRSTTWWFEYGASASYGGKTPVKSAGSKAGPQNVTAALAGLKNGTTYHYRLVAKSDAGTTYGSDLTFATLGVTIAVGGREVVFGGRVTLSGAVPSHAAGEQVIVFAQAYGRGSPASVATVLTGPGGLWSYIARPRIGTSYQAGWQGGISTPVAVGVHPSISLARTASGKLATHVTAGSGFRGRIVQLQRRTAAGKWETIRRGRLNRTSSLAFKVSLLPHGRSVVRVVMSINQAGAGYLGGKSHTITVRRS